MFHYNFMLIFSFSIDSLRQNVVKEQFLVLADLKEIGSMCMVLLMRQIKCHSC